MANDRPDNRQSASELDHALAGAARLARGMADGQLGYVALPDGLSLRLVGLEAQTRQPRKGALAEAALKKRALVWVQDVSKDKRLGADPVVAAVPHARFCAAVPIVLADGRQVGALCVVDRRARPYDGAFAEQLKDLADLAALAWPRGAAGADVTDRAWSGFVRDTPVGMVVTDKSLRILQCSRVWMETRGLTEEAIGKTLYEIHPAGRERWGAAYEEALTGVEVRAERVQIDLANGEQAILRVHMSHWRDAAGEVGGLMIMSHDVTELVEGLDRLERSERRLLMALELGQLYVWEFDYTRGEFSTGNPDAIENQAGLQRAESRIWDRVHPDDQPAAKVLWDEHLADGKPYRVDYRVQNPEDGAWVWASVTAEAIRNESGQVERIVGMMRNIERERQAEEKLGQALHHAEAANRAKSEFLANMSHEIRTPLNGVLGVAGALSKTALSDEQRGMVSLIEGSGQTLGALLTDILDLARIESGRLTLKSEPFALGELIRGAAALFEPDAAAKGLQMRLDLPAEAEQTVMGDAVRVRQVLSNLISNAVKFTDAGHVAVRVRIQAAADGKLAIALSVRDTGVGFDEAMARRLFNRFEQADGSSTRRKQGAGLGLAISKSLTEAMGGSLSVASRPGEGSSFTLKLTLGATAGPAPVRLAAEPVGAEVGAKVLLAEDHPTNRKVVELILNSVGVDLTSVENGQAAVEAAAAGAFDLILMDMQMPVMDGLTATRLIREREAQQDLSPIPILCLTANALPEHIEASKAAGADAHLTKPISAAALIAAVREASSRRASQSNLKKSA